MYKERIKPVLVFSSDLYSELDLILVGASGLFSCFISLSSSNVTTQDLVISQNKNLV